MTWCREREEKPSNWYPEIEKSRQEGDGSLDLNEEKRSHYLRAHRFEFGRHRTGATSKSFNEENLPAEVCAVAAQSTREVRKWKF